MIYAGDPMPTENHRSGSKLDFEQRSRNTPGSDQTREESTGLIRRILIWIGLSTAALALILLMSCDYSAPENLTATSDSSSGALPCARTVEPGGEVEPASSTQRGEEERTAILGSSITLIQRASLQPGGDNFKLAIQKLNHYFEGTSPSEYQMESASREFLKTQMPETMVNEIENRNWSPKDARHIEDCMMYYGIASRVAGPGDDLSRVRRVFDWVVRQTMLVPPGALGSSRLPHVFARPYDVLMRGMATEAEGAWAERAWLFISLCRQLDIDAGMITYSKNRSLELLIPRHSLNYDIEAKLFGLRQGAKPPVVWICAVLINDKAYLFDARCGLEVPGPGGSGVATLEQALADPAILERMNLPGELVYGTSRASLLGSRTKIGILIDSWTGYFAPKMRLLQRELAGKDRSILYRDPADQRDHFAQVLGDRFGGASLWGLPLEVETRLFTDQQFVISIQESLFLFRHDFPLVYARVKQLRGELKEAIEEYISLRFVANAPRVTNSKIMIPPDVQDGLDAYATYYLALAHWEKDNLSAAESMFKKTLELLPEPGPSQPYYHMLRWGASANLGRIYEAKKDRPLAIAYDIQRDPTSQHVGNLLRARELVWRDPIAKPEVLLPSPPPAKPVRRRSPAPAASPRAVNPP